MALLLASAPVAGTTGTAAVNDEAATNVLNPAFAQVETPSDNETTQHEDPDSVNEDGDTDSVRSWLENRLSGQLSESVIQIDQGEYEQGRELLGDSYDDILGKYVDVAGETDGGGDDETAEQFQEAKENQQNLSSETQDYRETVREYREARQNGNETQARQLGREANRLAGNINRTITILNGTYRTIGNQTEADVTDTLRVLGEIRTNVTTQQAEINDDLFVTTALSVRAQRANGSFVNPIPLSGRVTVENGTALANRTISIRVGSQIMRVPTDPQGRFSASYRPTIAPTGQQDIRVTYFPVNSSVYLTSRDRISVTISQTQPKISLRDVPQTVSFGDELSLTGQVSASERGAENVPVAITLDGIRLGTGRTNANGSFATDISVPAEVRSGSRTLRARVPLKQRALAPANVTQQVTVESTATSLTLAGEAQDDELLRVSGRLTTEDGTPVPNQQVTLAVGGDSLGSIQTDASGQFNETVPIPTAVRSNTATDTATLVASYAGTETSLEATRATTAIQIVPLQTGGEGGTNGRSVLSTILTNPLSWVLGPGVLAVVGVGLLRFRRDSDTDDGQQSAGEPSGSEGEQDEPAPALRPTEQLLSTARDRLEAGQLDTAVEAAYAAVRGHSAAAAEVPPGQTHWEWYAALDTSDLNGETRDGLRELTELYEQAAFAPDSVNDDRARRALAYADEFLSSN
jgi:hypothetical protein